MNLRPLTRRQHEIFSFVAEHIRTKGYAPSLHEIGVAHGLRSLATVHKHVTNLQARGYLARRWNESRSLSLVVQGSTCPTCGRELVVLSA